MTEPGIILGTPIVYHHRAAVARYRQKTASSFWELVEGVRKGMRMDTLEHESDMFSNWPKIEHKYSGYSNPLVINKTVMVWPEDGSGIVTGMVRRLKGVSHSASGGGRSGLFGDYYDSYDPGWFQQIEDGAFDLYVVRNQLKGTDYILVPLWAAIPMQLSREVKK